MAHISAPPRVTSIDVARRAGVSQSTVSLVLSGQGPGPHLRAHRGSRPRRRRRARLPPERRRPRAAHRRRAQRRARRPGHHEPVLRPRAPRRPALRPAGRLHRRAGRHRQQPRLGGRLAARRCSPARPTACCSSRPTSRPGTSEHAIQIEMCPGGATPSCASTSRPASTSRSTTCSTLGHTKIGHVASNFDAPTFDLRRDRMAARLGDALPTVAAPFTFEAPRRPPRAAARRRTSPRCSATTTSSPAACTWPPASAGMRIPEDLSRRRLRRPRLRARARAAADDRRGGRRGPGRGGVRCAWRRTWRARRCRPSRSCRSRCWCASRPRLPRV